MLSKEFMKQFSEASQARQKYVGSKQAFTGFDTKLLTDAGKKFDTARKQVADGSFSGNAIAPVRSGDFLISQTADGRFQVLNTKDPSYGTKNTIGEMYDASGKFLGTQTFDTKEKAISKLMTAATKIGATSLIGMGIASGFGVGPLATGGEAAAGAAGAAGAGAGSGAGAGAIAGPGITYTASGAPVFGVIDTAIMGPGISYTAAGTPIFGIVDTSVMPGAGGALTSGAAGAGAAAGGGGAGAGAGAGATKAGLGALSGKLGEQALGAAASAGVSKLLAGGADDMPPPPTLPKDTPKAAAKTKAISEMPDPVAQQRARRRTLIEQLGRRGRASSVMTTGSGRLGG
jgi:hypothetical protein